MNDTTAVFRPMAFVAALLTAALTSAAPQIKIIDVKLTKPAENRLVVRVAARGEGVKVGSYALRMKHRPHDAPVPTGFIETNKRVFLGSGTDKGKTGLYDNGPLDQDRGGGTLPCRTRGGAAAATIPACTSRGTMGTLGRA